jgi:AbrB family looped-hinge helix DNA binding protein
MFLKRLGRKRENMRMTEVVRVDSRGRVTMPSSIRDAVRLSEGMYVILVADLDKREIRIVPFADPEAKLVEFRITFGDVPGALAKAAEAIASQGVDLLSSESRTLRRGESAEWIVVADVSKCKCKLKELEQKIIEAGAAKEVKFRNFP